MIPANHTTTNVLNLGTYFYKLAERSQDVFWVRGVDYKTHLYISPASLKIWGLSYESLSADEFCWFDMVHPDDIKRLEHEVERIKSNLQEDQTYFTEYRIVRPDNEIRRIQDISFPVYDADHQFIGFVGITKDVTQEKKRLAELEQASIFFRFFAERVPAAFWARDISCNEQLYLSPGYEKIWARSRESLYCNPTSWFDTLHPEDREKASNAERFRALNELGPDTQYEFRYRIYTPEREIRWVKDTSFPIYNEDNKFIGFAGIAEDITKEVLHEKALREAIQRAEVANQAKSDFLAMISHELRTPLNAILGMSQILKMKNLPNGLEEYIDIISNAGNNLLSLVSDILDFARLEAGKLSFSNEPFDLKALFTQIVHSMQYQAREKKLELILEYPCDNTSLVLGDANRVRQVLVNLIVNAIKFTEKGYIKVIVNCLKKTKTKGWFEVSVIDTGIGIREENLKKLFEKFNQIDSIYHRKHRGIGLGLAITKQLVETMGGNIQVESVFGKGSTFKFTLALKLKAQSENDDKIVTSSTNMKNSVLERFQYHLKILLVEDNLINQKIAKLMLEDFGCQVDIIDNGQSVMEKLNTLFHYDLIFMDVGLPDISGFDIVSRLRQEETLKEMPIVAMTAHILERDRQQAFIAGMNSIIAKPISYEEINVALETYAKK